jgi:hypothetical protein
MKYALVFLLSLLMLGCGGRPDAYAGIPLDHTWDIRFSHDMPDHPVVAPDGIWYFTFPTVVNSSVNYITKDTTPVTSNETVTMVFRVDYDPTTVFNFDPSECATPASVYLMLQRRDDDMQSDDYRWWSVHTPLQQGSGNVITVSVPLQPAYWTNLYGQPGSTRTDGFNAALANLAHIGMTFGGGCSAGHGINVSGGKAKFTLISYEVR